MTRKQQESPALFHFEDDDEEFPVGPAQEVSELLRQLILMQQRNNELLEQLVESVGAAQRQRASELGQWKEANPRLAKACRDAAHALGKVQASFIEQLTEDVSDQADSLMDGEFMLTEFVDRYGPRLAHLNGVVQVLTQLGSVSNSANKAPR